ncbi:MAG TPA: pilus assembly protein N-terminal domain-containing protein [Candidatus Acidoferrales bacterium]|nr:pilus assembly protein N-terminal domain-containing protein [Candidatus Acidoferrales bacterium]
MPMQRTNSRSVRHSRLGLFLGLLLLSAFSLDARSQDLIAGGALATDAEVQPAAVAAPAAAPAEIPQSEAPQSLHLMVGRSLVITSPTRIKRVSLADPTIAEVDVITPTQIVINGKVPGGVSLLLWDEADQSQAFEISVDVDVLTLTQKIHEVFPGEHIQIDTAKDMVVLSGKVSSAAIADRIVEIVKNATPKVTNMMEVPKVDLGEVLLEVKFAEIDRASLQQLGVNLLSLPGAKTVGSVSTQQFSPPIIQGQIGPVGGGSSSSGPTASASGTPASFGLSSLLNIFLYRPDLNLAATIQMLQNTNVLQILAEPNLLTTSGKEASFLAGGEFPYPVVQSSGGGSFPTVTIQFREFGVRLNFTPTVAPDGMIHLHVHPEVSSLDFADALTLQGFVIPAISTRKVDSDMDLRDGQTFAIAGLMDNRVTAQLAKMPGIGSVPILGKLFQSRSMNKSDDELIVVVTPRIVHPSTNPGVPNAEPKFQYPFLAPEANAAMPSGAVAK